MPPVRKVRRLRALDANLFHLRNDQRKLAGVRGLIAAVVQDRNVPSGNLCGLQGGDGFIHNVVAVERAACWKNDQHIRLVVGLTGLGIDGAAPRAGKLKAGWLAIDIKGEVRRLQIFNRRGIRQAEGVDGNGNRLRLLNQFRGCGGWRGGLDWSLRENRTASRILQPSAMRRTAQAKSKAADCFLSQFTPKERSCPTIQCRPSLFGWMMGLPERSKPSQRIT